tara:strand:+ start:361 stop:585 length:225 start_codon:yes stop_codon:yes gene_type:complete
MVIETDKVIEQLEAKVDALTIKLDETQQDIVQSEDRIVRFLINLNEIVSLLLYAIKVKNTKIAKEVLKVVQVDK